MASTERNRLASVVNATPAWPLIVNSSVAYALAFNVVFFVQEVFLVVPKALTPGLRPTLFHNNHTWSGHHPLAPLLQATGVVAILLSGLLCLTLLPALRPRSVVVRLLVLWLAFHGLIMGFAQIPIGALSSGSDVGMAMTYLQWSGTTKTALALLALLAIAVVALTLTHFVLQLATADEVATARLRILFVCKAATIPALLGTLLIIPFRLPRELVEVIAPPLIVAILGISWMQAGALWLQRDASGISEPARMIAWPMLAALLLLFVFFHLVLARGIDF